MMKQYMEIKERYKDAILFFRLGDFYEMFLEDAKIGSSVLSITLTKRDRGKDGEIPMCGVPFHAAESYIAKLNKAGYKVAICEQVSDPKKPGLVEREVVRVVTPGTVTDEKSLDKDKNNFIAALSLSKKSFGLAYCDISTGDFFAGETKDVFDILGRINPSEIILPKILYDNPSFLGMAKNYCRSIFRFGTWDSYIKEAGKDPAKEASKALLGYFSETQKIQAKHISKISSIKDPNSIYLDKNAILNLEIFQTYKEGQREGSLIWLLDKTKTPMGARTLRQWVLSPLRKKEDIEARLLSVEGFVDNPNLRAKIPGTLCEIYDMERILAKISLGTESPRDVIALKYSLISSLKLKAVLDLNEQLIRRQKDHIDENLAKVINEIEKTLNEDPPNTPREGGLIRTGIDQTLDSLKGEIENSSSFLRDLEAREKARTNIGSLKVRFNKVYGYYIEISKANLRLVPNDYIRKQTLVNAERFITEELKRHEEIVLRAEELINQREYEIYQNLIKGVLDYMQKIKACAKAVAVIDVIFAFSELAVKNNYVKPVIFGSDNNTIEIIDGRHPVIEQILPKGEFIPNNLLLNSKNEVLIITGPNMSGKSTFVRQNALIVLMAQIGSFVPAKEAKISPVDGIYTRIGASDILSKGYSTFMVEMIETANILSNATSQSLVILDEVGRGTSTYDGVSIAWAVVEHLAKKTHAKTLFATHYHELLKLSNLIPNVRNYQVQVSETKDADGVDNIIFLYKVIEGGASKSYGIHVAKLAGLPNTVIKRSYSILKLLEQRKIEKPERSLENSQLKIEL